MDKLTDEQKALVEQLRKDVAPIVENNAALKIFCNDHCYVRFLRARQWNLQKASKMLHATLEWRMDYKPHLIRWSDVKGEALTGKHYLYDTLDKEGRPMILMRPRFENTKNTDSQIKYLMYNLEIASRVADKSGVGKMSWLLDFEEYSLSNAPPLRVSIYCNHVLQNHYPERLGMAVCYHSPYLFSMTWKAVRPFIDPVTQQKIIFVDKGPKEADMMNERYHMDKMEVCLGGQRPDYVFNLEEYEKRMLQYDAEVSAELEAMEKAMAGGQAPEKPLPGSVDLDVAVGQATEGVQKAAVSDPAPEGQATEAK